MKNEILKLIHASDSIPKNVLKHVVVRISENPELLKELVPLLYTANSSALQKVGLIMSEVALGTPELFKPFISKMLQNLYNNPKNATKRNTLRVLQYLTLPRKQHDAAVDLCFQYLTDRKEAIAIKVFAMTVLAKIVNEYPELKNELILILEDQLQNGSAGFQSRANRTLQLLK